MSSNLAMATPLTDADAFGATPLRAPREVTRDRAIEIVASRSQKRRRPRIVYALVATGALFALLLSQLAISIALSDGAYRISALQGQQTNLSRSQQKLTEKLGVLSSPQNIANNANALGMVPNENPVYIDLGTGTVYGTPTAAAVATAGTADNVISNSLLKGVPVVTKDASKDAASGTPTTPTSEASASASSSATSGAAASNSTGGSVSSTANQLAAPQTR